MVARVVPPAPVSVPADFARAAGVPPLVAEVLYRRGYTSPQAVRAFLDPPLPAKGDVPGLAEAAAGLAGAVAAREVVMVILAPTPGAICAGALLLRCLAALGVRHAWRVEAPGYPPAGAALRVEAGGRVVPAPGGPLPTAAWVWVRELFGLLGQPLAPPEPWLDLAAMGILAEGAPLVGGNRALTRAGLARIAGGATPGVAALAAAAGLAGAPAEAVAPALAGYLEAAARQGLGEELVRLLLAGDPGHARSLARNLLAALARVAAPAVAGPVGAPVGHASAGPAIPPPVREADAILPLAQATRETYEAFQALAPFGPGNPRPLFLARGATVLSSRPLGAGRALRLILRDATGTAAALWPGGEGAEVPAGPVDVAFTLEVEPWHGAPVLHLVVQALQPHHGAALEPASPPDPATPAGPLEWVDRRGTPAHLLAAAYPDAQFLAEGPDAGLAGQVDRYRVHPCTTLVWLTPPPSPRVWDEVLALAAPRRVVLGWPAQPAGRAPFLRTLLGLVRYAAAHRGGAVAVAGLACRTGELEAAVVAALEALAASGAMSLRPLGSGRLQVTLAGTGPARLAPGPARRRLEALLRESAAFRAFLARAPLAALRRALDPREDALGPAPPPGRAQGPRPRRARPRVASTPRPPRPP